MSAAGIAHEAVARQWFSRIFRKAPELKGITISALKRNFGRCAVRSPFERPVSPHTRGSHLL
jgi:hypothetical protein